MATRKSYPPKSGKVGDPQSREEGAAALEWGKDVITEATQEEQMRRKRYGSSAAADALRTDRITDGGYLEMLRGTDKQRKLKP